VCCQGFSDQNQTSTQETPSAPFLTHALLYHCFPPLCCCSWSPGRNLCQQNFVICQGEPDALSLCPSGCGSCPRCGAETQGGLRRSPTRQPPPQSARRQSREEVARKSVAGDRMAAAPTTVEDKDGQSKMSSTPCALRCPCPLSNAPPGQVWPIPSIGHLSV